MYLVRKRGRCFPSAWRQASDGTLLILSTRDEEKRSRERSVLILEESRELFSRSWKSAGTRTPRRDRSIFVSLVLQRRQSRKSNEIEQKEYSQHAAQRHRISLRVTIFNAFGEARYLLLSAADSETRLFGEENFRFASPSRSFASQ